MQTLYRDLTVVVATSQKAKACLKRQKKALVSCIAYYLYCLPPFSCQFAFADKLVRHMHPAIAHSEWRTAYSDAFINRIPDSASSSAPQATAVPTSTASTDKQSEAHGLEHSLQTLYRAGQLDALWDMLLQIYPQLEVGITWCILHPASQDHVSVLGGYH